MEKAHLSSRLRFSVPRKSREREAQKAEEDLPLQERERGRTESCSSVLFPLQAHARGGERRDGREGEERERPSSPYSRMCARAGE